MESYNYDKLYRWVQKKKNDMYNILLKLIL